MSKLCGNNHPSTYTVVEGNFNVTYCSACGHVVRKTYRR